MMEKTDVLVIGGSAAGIVAATTGKNNYPEKDFLLVRQEEQAVVPCGIPYIFGSLDSTDKNTVPDAVLAKANVNLKIGEVVSIDTEKKICQTNDGTEISFEKLILATGSTPAVPKWLEGADLENVFFIPKNKVYLNKILAQLHHCQKVVTVGGGFIGVEISDELGKKSKDVTLVELLPHILGLAFDEELALEAERILQERGIKIKTNTAVKKIIGEQKVSGVQVNDGDVIEAEAVLLSMGYRPNVSLAKNSGLKISEKGFITVDEYMRTDNPDVFAVGD